MALWRMPWQRSIGPIGLDLGSDVPRAMQVRLGVDEPVASATARTVPSAGIADRARAAALAMRAAGFVGREVAVALPSPFARMHVARLPKLSEREERDAVAWDAAERLALPRDSIVADAVETGAPASNADGKEERLVVAAHAGELAAALDHLIDAGFDPISAEPRFASVARALSRRSRRESDLDRVRAALHVDDDASFVVIVRGDRVAFCREIPFGGNHLDTAVAERLSVPLESARQLRLRRLAATAAKAPPADAVTEEAALAATRPTIDALAGELALCLRYFGVTFRGGQPARVVLSGPHGAEPRLAGIVEETSRVAVVSFEAELPAGATSRRSQELTAEGGLARWTVAYGTACRGLGLRKEAAA